MIADSTVAEQQVHILNQIALMQASSTRMENIEHIIKELGNTLKEWMILDKYLSGDKYAVKKMLVQSLKSIINFIENSQNIAFDDF